MADRSIYATTLELTGLDDLFRAPDISPFDDRYRDHSRMPALEFIADEVYANSTYRAADVTFVVPEVEGRSIDEVRGAIGRWASAHARGHGHDVTATRWRGLRSLIVGVVGFAVFIALSQAIGDGGDDLLSTFAKGLEVLAWIVIWFPLETLIYSVWQHRLDRRSFQVVRDMQVTITESAME